MHRNESKFNFDEVVEINTSDPKRLFLNKMKGVVSGKAQSDDSSWTYGIWVFNLEEVRCCDENELISTGEIAPNYNKKVGTIRVTVNSEGEGSIKED